MYSIAFNVTKRIVAYNESIVLGFKSTNDLEFRIVFKGKNYTRVNGVSLRELIGKSVEFITSPSSTSPSRTGL
jgi:hypothetical protein